MVVERNATITQWDTQRRPLWSASAREAAVRAATGTAELKDASCRLYQAGKLVWTCSAPKILADQPRRRLTLSGGVLARSADGTHSFRAASAVWNAGDRRIRGSGGVVFRMGEITLTGGTLTLSTQDGSWTLEGGAPPSDGALQSRRDPPREADGWLGPSGLHGAR